MLVVVPGSLPRLIAGCLLAFAPGLHGSPGSDLETAPELLPSYIGHNLGQYSPYFPVAKYEPIEPFCTLTQVNLLYRHGSRNPTASAGKKLQATLAKLKSVQNFTDARLNFLHDYTYRFGADSLLPYGALEGERAGQEAFTRYERLSRRSRQAPFVRASSSQRVVDTATNWTAGYVSAGGLRPSSAPVVLSEADGFNNTLDDGNCPGQDTSIADSAQAAYLETFAPNITARLNRAAPGANLNDNDVVQLFFFCGFDTIFYQKASKFCDLFSAAEYQAFEYYQDLGKYYNTGYGNPLGAVQGIGYVSELIARLTDSPVKAVANVNTTLDAADATFPLDRALYADFSHDNEMTAIYAALGIHRPSRAPLPTDHALSESETRFVASRLVPFAARLVTERYACAGGLLGGQWVRVLNDDEVQEIPGCARRLPGGLCELGAFVKSQAYTTGGAVADWAACQT